MTTYIALCKIDTPRKGTAYIMIRCLAKDPATAAMRIQDGKFEREWWTDKSTLSIVQLQTLDEMLEIPALRQIEQVRRRRRR